MKKIKKTEIGTLAYSASSQVPADVPRDGVITRIDCEVQVTPSATMVGANLPMGIWHIIDTLRLVGGGGKQYIGMGSGELLGRLIHGLNQFDFPGMPFVGARDLTAPNTTFVPVVFRLHFGSRPRDMYGRDNPFDLSAFVPAHRESSLKMEWGCPANSVMDGTVTISAATMKMTVYQILGSSQEIRDEMARQGLDPDSPMSPVSSTESYNHTGAISDLGKQFDIPTGNFLRRIAIMAEDATTVPVLAMDEITRVGLLLPQSGERIVDVDFSSLVTGQMPGGAMLLADEGASVDTYLQTQKGIAILDLRAHGYRDYGMDTRALKNGDVKLGVTIGTYTSGDKSYIHYDQLEKIVGALM